MEGAAAVARLRSIISALEKVEKLTRREVSQPSQDFTLHPSMIRNVEKALTLSERALRSPEEKARDRDAQKAQQQIDILNRKLKKLER